MNKKRFFTFVMSQVRLRREVKRGKRIGLFGAACVTAPFSGCSGFHATIGTADGIREYARGQNGLITNGKASDDADSSYWRSDRHNELERTERDPFYNFTRSIRGAQTRGPK